MEGESVKKSIESIVGKSYADIAIDGRTSRTNLIKQLLEKVSFDCLTERNNIPVSFHL